MSLKNFRKEVAFHRILGTSARRALKGQGSLGIHLVSDSTQQAQAECT